MDQKKYYIAHLYNKNKPDDFNSRLGKKDIIQEEIPMDKLIRKQRYLNTTSNKKKVWAFNQDSKIIDLEQIRLLYNEIVSLYNRNAEKHSNPIRKKKINEFNKKKREEKLNKINDDILQARLGNQDIIKKKIEETKIHFQLVLKTEKTFMKNW